MSFWEQADCSLTTGFSGPKSSRDFQETGPWFNSPAALAHSQLACLLSGGIVNLFSSIVVFPAHIVNDLAY